MKKIRNCAVLLLLLTVLTATLAACAGNDVHEQRFFTLDDLKGPDKNFTLWFDCGYDPILKKAYPEAGMVFGINIPDLALNIRQGKADAMLLPEPFFRYHSEELRHMSMLPGDLGTIDFALIFSSTPTGDSIRTDFNNWLAAASSDGTLEELSQKWFGPEQTGLTIDSAGLDPDARHIRVGLAPDEPPFSFLWEGELTGHDAEVIIRFCRDCGYYPEISEADYEAMILSVQADKYDVIGAGYEITEERKETISFSDPVSSHRLCVAVLGDGEKTGLFESISRSFHRAFVEDDRYLLFLNGIGVTALIALCSIILGLFLGFGLYFLYRDGGTIPQKLLDLLSAGLNRIPSVVLLMFVYYVFFGNVDISPTLVSILLFSVLFGFSTFSALELAVASVGREQAEAAFTLGLNRNECFFHIILPQGRSIFMSNLKGSIVSLLLETAVVGYISVSDLTHVGDIVRNNTYEAFFPLLAVAVFYLLISSIIIAVIEAVEQKADPMRRTKEEILHSIIDQKTSR